MAGNKKRLKKPPNPAEKFTWRKGDVKIVRPVKKEGEGRSADVHPKESRAKE
jgi:hypothetical protein